MNSISIRESLSGGWKLFKKDFGIIFVVNLLFSILLIPFLLGNHWLIFGNIPFSFIEYFSWIAYPYEKIARNPSTFSYIIMALSTFLFICISGLNLFVIARIGLKNFPTNSVINFQQKIYRCLLFMLAILFFYILFLMLLPFLIGIPIGFWIVIIPIAASMPYALRTWIIVSIAALINIGLIALLVKYKQKIVRFFQKTLCLPFAIADYSIRSNQIVEQALNKINVRLWLCIGLLPIFVITLCCRYIIKSIPFLKKSLVLWWIHTLILGYIMVPIFILAGMYAYLKMKETRPPKDIQ